MANHGSTSSQKGKATSAAVVTVVKYVIVVIHIVIIVVIQLVIESKSIHVCPASTVRLYVYVVI